MADEPLGALSKIGSWSLPPVPSKWNANWTDFSTLFAFFASTSDTAYITTKNAKSSVMKSAYETSQRSWFSCSLCLCRFGIARRRGGFGAVLQEVDRQAFTQQMVVEAF